MFKSIQKLLIVVLCTLSYTTKYYCNVYHGVGFEGEGEGSKFDFAGRANSVLSKKGEVSKNGISFGHMVEGLLTNEVQPFKDYLPAFMIIGPKAYSFDYEFITTEGEVLPITISYNLHTDCDVSDVVVKAENFQVEKINVYDYKADLMYMKYSGVYVILKRT